MPATNPAPERRTIADGWRPANDSRASARIWKRTIGDQLLRFEADYYRDGKLIETLTARTLDDAIDQLQAKYGPAKE